MSFDFLTFLRRLFILIGIIVLLIGWLLVSGFVGGYFGNAWGFALYMSPAVVAFAFLLGLK
jgi:hypothetical protein